jgi:hypothetical protein
VLSQAPGYNRLAAGLAMKRDGIVYANLHKESAWIG